MAKRSKAQSKILITQLIVVGLILAGVAIFLNSNFELRSKAAFNPSQACTSACRSGAIWIKNAGACALDCPNVASGAMSCNTFCSENVKPSADTQTGQTSQSICRKSCERWVGDPCSNNGQVCKFANGADKGLAKSQCSTACNLVKDEEQTCDEAMTQASLSAVMNQLVPAIQQACIKYFE